LSRVTGLVGQTSEGCKILSEYGAVIILGIRNCMRPSFNFEEALRYVSGLCLNLLSKSIHIGPALCDAGIYFAARVGIFPALSRYINIAYVEDYPTSKTQLLGLKWTYRQLEMTHNRARQGVLSLLTGWKSSGIPDCDEVRKPSFAQLAQKSHAMYSAYVDALGKAGAREALWHEWLQPELTPMPSLTWSEPALNAADGDINQSDDEHQSTKLREELRAETFFDAFIEAKDLYRAKDLRHFVLKGEDISDQTVPKILLDKYPTKDEYGTQSDMQLRNALLSLYLRHGISNVDSATLRRDIHSVRGLTRAMEELLSDAEDLLQVIWVEDGAGYGFHVRKDDSLEQG